MKVLLKIDGNDYNASSRHFELTIPHFDPNEPSNKERVASSRIIIKDRNNNTTKNFTLSSTQPMNVIVGSFRWIIKEDFEFYGPFTIDNMSVPTRLFVSIVRIILKFIVQKFYDTK